MHQIIIKVINAHYVSEYFLDCSSERTPILCCRCVQGQTELGFQYIVILWSICLYNVAIEPFYTWLEMRDRAQQGHLLLIRFSTVASNSQVGGRGGESGVGRAGC